MSICNLYLPYTLGALVVIAIILLGILIKVSENNEHRGHHSTDGKK